MSRVLSVAQCLRMTAQAVDVFSMEELELIPLLEEDSRIRIEVSFSLASILALCFAFVFLPPFDLNETSSVCAGIEG